MTWREELAINLRKERMAKGWSQDDLARIARFHPSAISHFEDGRRVPSLYNFTRLCAALNVNPDWLLPEGQQG
jgi:transcriptional regulator with XRE-family HTH domain